MHAIHVGSGLAYVLAMVFTVADAPEARSENQYEFEPDLNRQVCYLQNGLKQLGHLDVHGNFVRDPKYKPVPIDSALSSWPIAPIYNYPLVSASEIVYEYRSGSLVKGTLSSEGIFVPEAGSVVGSMKEYLYSEKAVRIYNLPGIFVVKRQGK